MAKARKLERRRRSVRDIRKITRTMELIATAKFKRAMDRAIAATAFTRQITAIVSNLARAGTEVHHPLLVPRESPRRAVLLVLTANRGLCGGYNSGVVRLAGHHWNELYPQIPDLHLEVSGKRGISWSKWRGITPTVTYTHFDDKPRFEETQILANRFLEDYISGNLDRLDVVYTQFVSSSNQTPVAETLLPLGQLEGTNDSTTGRPLEAQVRFEFLPSAASILEEVVPLSFRCKLFKCFLDAAVSEQIARMVAMKSATENADELIRELALMYNRARQTQITSELMDIVGGVEALK